VQDWALHNMCFGNKRPLRHVEVSTRAALDRSNLISFKAKNRLGCRPLLPSILLILESISNIDTLLASILFFLVIRPFLQLMGQLVNFVKDTQLFLGADIGLIVGLPHLN